MHKGSSTHDLDGVHDYLGLLAFLSATRPSPIFNIFFLILPLVLFLPMIVLSVSSALCIASARARSDLISCSIERGGRNMILKVRFCVISPLLHGMV